MADGLFQITVGENLVGFDNLAKKSDLDGSTILLRTSLRGLAIMNLIGGVSLLNAFPGNYAE